jgi:catechol 2,3-dioxygenase-like lactoylglutathione lyase family enzyme
MSGMDWTLEVVILPVSDLGAAIEFYRDKVGFHLDHRTTNESMDIAQLTPEGSGCSIVVGNLPSQQEMAPGSMRGLQLVVADAAAAREELVGRGVECSDVTVFDERDGGTFFGFADPDGNTWAVQQLKARGDKPLIPFEHRGRFGAEDQPRDQPQDPAQDRD